MYRIKPLPTLEMRWGVVDGADRPLLFVEMTRGPEYEVHQYQADHPSGRGALLATFFGSNAFEQACDWVTTVELPRLLRSTKSMQSSTNEVLLSEPGAAEVREVAHGVREDLAG
jgi:hypothetical protein